MVLSETNTESYTVLSVTPSTTTTGSRQDVPADEIAIDFNHTFTFKAPLPKAAKSITIHTTLLIWSSEKEGKIVRLQDRPKDDISDNSFLSVCRSFLRGSASRSIGLGRHYHLGRRTKERRFPSKWSLTKV